MPNRAKAPFLYELEVNLSRILVLRTEKDFRAFRPKYAPDGMVDWGKVGQDYDGIEICPYQPKFRDDFDFDWYYPWDVASGCIWGAGAFKSAELVEVCGVRKQAGEARLRRIQMKREASARLRSAWRGDHD